jgi:hypothetical protein
VPSRELLWVAAEKLDIPLRERNVLLLASGYSPVYSDRAWEDREMTATTQAINRLLD